MTGQMCGVSLRLHEDAGKPSAVPVLPLWEGYGVLRPVRNLKAKKGAADATP